MGRVLILALLVLAATDQTLFGQQIAQTPDQPTTGEKPSDVDDPLADKEMSIGREYMLKLNFIGAVNRFKIVMSEYQTSRNVPEALAQEAVIFLVLGIRSEAQTAVAVLGRKFPNSRWYTASRDLLKHNGLEPLEDEGSWISKTFKKAL
jgi:outer membrane protein assembly factor BamD